MKIKQLPEDFQVEELTERVPGGAGPFAFYRLEKTGWTTPDALQAIRRRWNIDHRRFSYGGLKDRHATTRQYLTIFHGPQRNLTHQRLNLEYLGLVANPYTSTDIAANRFQVSIRALKSAQVNIAKQALEEVAREGVPNYFDDQRFGSVQSADDFMARYLALGRFEDALRKALTAPYEYDRAIQKKEKGILNAHWGDWPKCKALLPRGHARSLVDYLVHHPADFRGAVARLRPELRGLYLSAYQSYLWNRMLDRWLAEHLPPAQLIRIGLRLGKALFHRGVEEKQMGELAQLVLPLPSPRAKLEVDDPRRKLLDAVLSEDGITLEQLKLKGLREIFFSKGERAALCKPTNLRWDSATDELNRGREKLTLNFDLPRGSYATLIVKRITRIAAV